MHEHEPEHAQDEQDVEITDLDESGMISRPMGPARVLSWLAEFPLDRRYRRPVTLVTAVILVLAVVLMLAKTFSAYLLWPGSGVEPSTQPRPPGRYTYSIQADPPWGHLYVDGLAARLSPAQGLTSIILSSGQHELTWRAEPFPEQRCTLVVPPGAGVDTCKHLQLSTNGPASSLSIVVFRASLGLLEPKLRTTLIQAAQNALDLHQSSETVQPGEIYAISSLSFNPSGRSCTATQDAVLCYQSASQPLHATVSFQLDTDTSASAPCMGGACIYNGEDCRLFCDSSAYDGPIADTSPSDWNAFAIVHILWHYHTAQGRLAIPVQTDSFVWSQRDEYLIPLGITWDGVSWHVAAGFDNAQAPLGNPMCDAAISDVSTLLYADARSGFSFESVPAPTFALGCLIKVGLLGGPGSGPVPSAYFLHRFGVLLAVDDAAHRLLPFLPAADHYAIQLARQLGANAG